MKFAFSTTTFRTLALNEAIEAIARGGFSAAELMVDRPHAFPEDVKAPQVAALNECMERRKVKIINLNASSCLALGSRNHPSWLEEDWKARETRIRYSLDAYRLAAAMGVSTVTIQGGGPIPDTMKRDEAWRLFTANMERVLPLAKKLGIKILVQAEPGFLLERPDKVTEFLAELRFDDHLRVDFNVGHFYCAGIDPCEAWQILHKHAAHIHLEDVPADRMHRHVQLGEGSIDIPRFLKMVEESSYDGYVTIKLDAHDQDAGELVCGAAIYLNRNGFLAKRPEGCP
jgi:sugar phosphate isomerase/epimerase